MYHRKNIDKNRKSIIFGIEEDTHARLRIQLRYDKLTQTNFFNYLIKGYLENNEHIRNYMDFILSEKLSNRVKRNRKNDRKEEKSLLDNMALNDEEIENIFDILESENPDL